MSAEPFDLAEALAVCQRLERLYPDALATRAFRGACNEVVSLRAILEDSTRLLARMRHALELPLSDGLDPVPHCLAITREIRSLRERVAYQQQAIRLLESQIGTDTQEEVA